MAVGDQDYGLPGLPKAPPWERTWFPGPPVVATGWRCPGCQRCYSPTVVECSRCGQVGALSTVPPVVPPVAPSVDPKATVTLRHDNEGWERPRCERCGDELSGPCACDRSWG